MNVDDGQRQSLKALAQWSRWLIGVAVLAASGCITILKIGAAANQLAALQSAIAWFLASLIVAAALGIFISIAIEKLRTEWWLVTSRFVGCVQLVLLLIGTWFLYGWVSNAGPVTAAAPPANADEVLRSTVRSILGEELE